MADLGIQDSNDNETCVFDNTKYGYEEYPCVCSGNDSDCSQTKKELYKIGPSLSFFLGDNSETDTCNARIIYLKFGGIGLENRAGGSYVLCR